MSSSKVSTGTTLSQNYYLRRFYENQTSAFKSAQRKAQNTTTLSNQDITALHKAVRKLQNFDYEKESPKDENGNSSITNAISAFVDIYNNTLDSSVKLDDHDVERYIKQMKKITRENKSKLRDMGIEIKNGGKLEIKKSLLTAVKSDKIKEVFSKENSYMRNLQKTARRFQYKSEEIVYCETTGNGNTINLAL